MFQSKRFLAAAALAACSAIMLTGCLLTPGKFASELRLMRDGTFAFSYVGQIQMVDLAKLDDMDKSDSTFAAECYDDEFEERDCTEEEVTEQRKTWDDGAEARAEAKAIKNAQMRAIFGGIDPSDPKAAQEIAVRLERQRGWDKVTYLGNGLFDVQFRISGPLSHDFAFPTMEGLPVANSFVTAYLRDNGQVRVDAPGFVALSASNPLQSMMLGEADLSKTRDGDKPIGDNALEGRFAIVTDGSLLANNTDQGAVTVPQGQRLEWTINARTAQAPTALVGFN